MTVIDRYLFKTVTASALLVLLVLLTLEVLFILIDELEDLGEGAYDLAAVGQFLLLSLPGLVYQTLPMALLVGGLLGVGGLAAANELVAMRASGWSPTRLLAGALAAALLLGGAALLIGEFIAPQSERLARQLRAGAKQIGGVQSDKGFWARDGDIVIRVGALLPDVTLADVELFQVGPQGRIVSVLAAALGRYQQDGKWLLSEVKQSRFEHLEVTTEAGGKLLWETSLRPDTLRLLAANPDHLALSDLSGYIQYLRGNGLDARHYQLAFWHKLSVPLTCVATLLIGLPFAFGRSRISGAGQRLLLGVLLGLLFFLMNRLLGSWVLLSGLPPVLGALAPPVAFIAAGLIPLRRLR